MHNPESVLENKTHKVHLDFVIQTDHLISTRRPDLIIINKNENNRIVNFAVPPHHRVKLKEYEKRDKYLDLARELKNLWNMKMTILPIVIGALGTVNTRLGQGFEDLEVVGWLETVQTTALLKTLWQEPCQRDDNRGIGELGNKVRPSRDSNTEKSPGDLRRLAVIQNPVRNHQLT